MLLAIGILAVIFKMAGDIGLVIGTWKREIVLHRFTWLIFSLTAYVFLDSQLRLGIGWGSLFFIWILFVNLVLLALSLTRGRGIWGLTVWEKASLVVAFASIVMLLVTDEPLAALLLTILADILGAWMTIWKAWLDPSTEIPKPWMYGTIGSFLSMVAVGSLDFALLIGPFYFFLFDGAMWWIAARRQAPVTT